MIVEKIFNPLSSFHHKRIFNYLCKLDIDKIIDIGAHKGEFLEKMLNMKSKLFYAFEPQKIFKTQRKILKNKRYYYIIMQWIKEISNKKLKISKLSMTSSL